MNPKTQKGLSSYLIKIVKYNKINGESKIHVLKPYELRQLIAIAVN